jgi:hypothetical protein
MAYDAGIDAGAATPAGRARGEAELEERPGARLFILPGGYFDGRGGPHREALLAPPTGHDEEYLARLAPQAPVASVVTGLLARCLLRVGDVERGGAALTRDLLVCDRDYLLVRLRELAFGPKVEAVLTCRRPECRLPMDVSFSLDELPFGRDGVSRRFFTAQLSAPVTVESGGVREETRLVEFRLPTGADQEALAAETRADEGRALRRLLARTLRRVGSATGIDEALVNALPEGAREEIAAEMKRLSPSVEIELEGECPECGTPFSTQLDVASFFIAEMRGSLHALERSVHFLAWHYHWSEREILSMTRRKRQRYVELLREELEGSH